MTTTLSAGGVQYGRAFEIRDIKASDNGWQVAGYASVFEVVDHGGDVVQRGAYTDSVAAWHAGEKKIRFLYQHDTHEPLGVPLELQEDSRGLRGVFKISKTTIGEQVHTLLKDGAVDSFSIGYIPTDWQMDGDVRRLKTIDLLEVSIVTIPMLDEARVTGVKQRPRTRGSMSHAELRQRLLIAGRITPKTPAEHRVFSLGLHRRHLRSLGVMV